MISSDRPPSIQVIVASMMLYSRKGNIAFSRSHHDGSARSKRRTSSIFVISSDRPPCKKSTNNVANLKAIENIAWSNSERGSVHGTEREQTNKTSTPADHTTTHILLPITTPRCTKWDWTWYRAGGGVTSAAPHHRRSCSWSRGSTIRGTWRCDSVVLEHNAAEVIADRPESGRKHIERSSQTTQKVPRGAPQLGREVRVSSTPWFGVWHPCGNKRLL